MDDINVTFSADDLNQMARKVSDNTADAKDYENLNIFLSSFGLKDYLKIKFKEMNVFDFETFIFDRNRPQDSNELRRESRLVGVVLGAIEGLKKRI